MFNNMTLHHQITLDPELVKLIVYALAAWFIVRLFFTEAKR